jgi:adenine-specific DNA-methyltransferase
MKPRLDTPSLQRTDAISQGTYTTPEILAKFLVDWAVRNPSDTVVEPCCGDGVFLEAIASRIMQLEGNKSDVNRIIGVEIDPHAAKQAYDRLLNHFQAGPKIIPKGFFSTLPSLPQESFDAVIGNPPFVKYRFFFKDERELALEFLQEQGFKASKLTNAWVPFLVAGIHLLKPKGRLAMVMPAELLQVSYASEVREYLLNRFGFVFVVAFNSLVFPNVEQEIVLLMGIKGDEKGLRLIGVEDENALFELGRFPEVNIPQIPVEDSREKWTQYFLRDDQRKALREAMNNNLITRLGQLCSVDVGVVTGKNRFFVLSKDDALKLEAQNHLLPVVTRTRYLQGLIFREHDWRGNVDTNRPSYLLAIKDASDFSESLRKYITSGEEKNWHKNYKCSIRRLWYVVPSIWIPDAFLSRKIGSFPRLVLNSAEATCTDNLLRVKFKRTGFERIITTCFHNSLTSAFAEIFGRSYGGGVLELMPTEAEKLPVPIPKSNSKSLFSEMDKLIREGLQEEAIELCDQRVLIEELGCKKENIAIIKSAWRKLSKRRKSRHRRNLIHSQPIYN